MTEFIKIDECGADKRGALVCSKSASIATEPLSECVDWIARAACACLYLADGVTDIAHIQIADATFDVTQAHVDTLKRVAGALREPIPCAHLIEVANGIVKIAPNYDIDGDGDVYDVTIHAVDFREDADGADASGTISLTRDEIVQILDSAVQALS